MLSSCARQVAKNNVWQHWYESPSTDLKMNDGSSLYARPIRNQVSIVLGKQEPVNSGYAVPSGPKWVLRYRGHDTPSQRADHDRGQRFVNVEFELPICLLYYFVYAERRAQACLIMLSSWMYGWRSTHVLHFLHVLISAINLYRQPWLY
jgi:hypothetical protein